MDQSDPIILRSDNVIPKHILEDHSIFITAQEVMELDEDDKDKVVYVKNCMHHKLLVTTYSPTEEVIVPTNDDSDDEEEEDEYMGKYIGDSDSIIEDRKTNPTLLPGHLIEFHEPAQHVIPKNI